MLAKWWLISRFQIEYYDDDSAINALASSLPGCAEVVDLTGLARAVEGRFNGCRILPCRHIIITIIIIVATVITVVNGRHLRFSIFDVNHG